MNRYVTTALAFLAVAGAVLALIALAQRRLIYFPATGLPSLVEAGLDEGEPVTFDTSDGLRLGAWFVPASGPPPRVTVVVFNGNAGNRAYRAPLAASLRRHGLQVLLTDYRGYGGNPGAPSEQGLAADARAALQYLRSRAGRRSGAHRVLRRVPWFGRRVPPCRRAAAEGVDPAIAVHVARRHRTASLPAAARASAPSRSVCVPSTAPTSSGRRCS